MKWRLFSNMARPWPGRSRGSCAKLLHAVFAVALTIAFAPIASAQIGSLDKGHQILVNEGLQIWGLNTDDAYQFNYSNLAAAGMDAVIWSTNEATAGLLAAGQNWGKWIEPNPSAQYYTPPSSALTATETAHYADLVAIQVGDEQQADLESTNGFTQQWFNAAHSGNYFSDKLLYVNSTSWSNVNNYFNFIGNANPDAISFDAYPFGSVIPPYNWLGKAQFFRRSALGSYIQASNNSPRPYGLYLQTYHGGDGARDPSELEIRWQMFTGWTLGYTFVDAFTAGGGNTSLFNSGNENLPTQPTYNYFKESARQSHNLGPALTKLISYGYGPNVVLGKDPNGVTNQAPGDWPTFAQANAPVNQQYLTAVSARSLSHKNGVDSSNPDGIGGFYGYAGDVYVGFFNPLLATYGDPAGEAYFMVTNALGAYLQDPTGLVVDFAQQITLHFNFGASGINSLERLRRSDGQVETVPLTHVSGSLYDLVFNLEGGTGDLFKYNDGTPFELGEII